MATFVLDSFRLALAQEAAESDLSWVDAAINAKPSINDADYPDDALSVWSGQATRQRIDDATLRYSESILTESFESDASAAAYIGIVGFDPVPDALDWTATSPLSGGTAVIIPAYTAQQVDVGAADPTPCTPGTMIEASVSVGTEGNYQLAPGIWWYSDPEGTSVMTFDSPTSLMSVDGPTNNSFYLKRRVPAGAQSFRVSVHFVAANDLGLPLYLYGLFAVVHIPKVIDDAVTSDVATWSSEKISDVLDGAGGWVPPLGGTVYTGPTFHTGTLDENVTLGAGVSIAVTDDAHFNLTLDGSHAPGDRIFRHQINDFYGSPFVELGMVAYVGEVTGDPLEIRLQNNGVSNETSDAVTMTSYTVHLFTLLVDTTDPDSGLNGGAFPAIVEDSGNAGLLYIERLYVRPLPTPAVMAAALVADPDALDVLDDALGGGDPLPTPGLVLIDSGSFAASAAEHIDNVFDGTYDDYRLVLAIEASSVDNSPLIRMRVGGVDASGANYNVCTYLQDLAGAVDLGGASQTCFNINLAYSATPNSAANTLDIFSPARAEYTRITGRGTNFGASRGRSLHIGGLHLVATSYDGFSIVASTGTLTGRWSLYGYSK